MSKEKFDIDHHLKLVAAGWGISREDLVKLREDLEIAEQNVKDFERLALEWKDSYLKMEKKLKIRITELEQTIEELEKERKNWWKS